MMKRILCICVGIICPSYLPALPPLWILIPLFVFGLWRLRYPRQGYVAALALGLVWGIGFGHWRLAYLLPLEWEAKDLVLRGEIMDMPVQEQGYRRFDLRVHELWLPTGAELPFKLRRVRLSWYGDRPADAALPWLEPGQQWQLKVRLRHPRGFANPHSANYETQLFRAGIGATGYVRAGADNLLLVPPGPGAWAQRLRFGLYQHLSQQLEGMERRGLLLALILGYSRDMAPEQRATIFATGTGHLFVISGLHIGLIALVCYSLAFPLARLLLLGPPRLPAQQPALALALLGAAGYSLLAGFALPTQRALIMCLVVLGGRMFGWMQDIGQALALALLVVLLWDPLAAQSPGFWLSFGAVAALVFAHQGRAGAARWLRWTKPQAVVFVGLLPLTLIFFGQTPLCAPLANLVAVPLVGLLIVPLSLGATLLSLWHEASALWLFRGLDQLLAWLLQLLAWLADWPALSLAPEVSLLALLLALLGASFILLPRGMPGRWLGGLCLLPLLWREPELPAAQEFWLRFYDVGQGLAVLVQTRNHALLYDTGPRYSPRFNAADAVILPDLRARGIDLLDLVLISHGDNDHAGALPALLLGQEVKALIDDRQLRLFDRNGSIAVRPCRAGERWSWDGVNFSLLQAPARVGASQNYNSCVLSISSDSYRVLLAGDIDSAAESRLLAQFGDELAADLLLVPHHGSASSSSAAFIGRVAPRLAVVAHGYRNAYGHPHAAVVARYQARDISLLSTAALGAIEVRSASGERRERISAWRQQYRRYWLVEDVCGGSALDALKSCETMLEFKQLESSP